MKKIIIVWLWYQGKIFIKFFLKKGYEVIWVCKTEQTKKKIESEYNIEVFLDYKIAIKKNLDVFLIVLCAYPIDFYEDFLNFVCLYNIKILTDLPISFNLNFLDKIVSNDNIYFLLLETKMYFFEKFFNEKKIKIECNLYFNRENLLSIRNPREFLLVDSQYLYNNFLGFDLSKIKLNFLEKKSIIKNLEYLIIVNDNFFYKYEDWKILYYDKRNNIKKVELIIYDYLLDKILFDIENWKNLYKEEYLKNFTYLFKKYYV